MGTDVAMPPIRAPRTQRPGCCARGKANEVFLQGSYKNDTNLGGDSDVDVVVRLTRSRFLSSGSLTETLA